MPVYDQIEIACEQIRNDPNLQDGYHAVGFSQGSQFLRGVAQVCPEQWSSSVLAILFLLLLARSFSGNELFSSRSLGKNFRAQSSELLSE